MVFEGGLSPSYIADEAEIYELSILMENLQLRHRESWEQSRLIAYITAQVNSTKKLKPTDILTFSWDKAKKEGNTSISDADIERIKEKAEKYIKKEYGSRSNNEDSPR